MVEIFYPSQAFAFEQKPVAGRMSLVQAAERVRDGKEVAVLLDMVSSEQLHEWWMDDAFSPITRHPSFSGAAKSGLSIGPVQRLRKEKLALGLINYFSYGARSNVRLEQTKFVQVCARELGATAARLGDWGELPLVSKREYGRNNSSEYNIPPHCDAIHFGRDTCWPIPVDYSDARDQVSLFLTIKQPDNQAGLVIWDVRPESRAELDVLLSEYGETGGIRCLRSARKVVMNSRPGQMSVLNTRLMHALEACSSTRQTVGSFAVWSKGAWRIFH